MKGKGKYQTKEQPTVDGSFWCEWVDLCCLHWVFTHYWSQCKLTSLFFFSCVYTHGVYARVGELRRFTCVSVCNVEAYGWCRELSSKTHSLYSFREHVLVNPELSNTGGLASCLAQDIPFLLLKRELLGACHTPAFIWNLVAWIPVLLLEGSVLTLQPSLCGQTQHEHSHLIHSLSPGTLTGHTYLSLPIVIVQFVGSLLTTRWFVYDV